MASFLYLDHNATAPIRPEVREAMLPYLAEQFGNPSSVHRLGQRARAAVEAAREQVARLVGAAEPQEIVFTSCGSESDVLAIEGVLYEAWRRSSGTRRHWITSSIEHEVVLEVARLLNPRGFEVTFLPVDGQGLVDAQTVRKALRPETALVSVMHANNEVGTLQPIREIAAICRQNGVLFHTDAVQSAGKVPISAQAWGVDLLSISGHKLNAPKGIGALYVRRGIVLSPLVCGKQEKNRRGGTENVASAVGLGVACELAVSGLTAHAARTLEFRNRLEQGVLESVPGTLLCAGAAPRLPNTSCFLFESVDGNALVIALDLEGLCASSGPACSAGVGGSSHVLKAMGFAPSAAKGALRISTGWGNTEQELEKALEVVPACVARLREAVRA
ncbi:MAG: cysteine desulfurase [Elusimicrobia bacterium]|nr:cysteine desulfurase [Elusimicrobiota bacterium]